MKRIVLTSLLLPFFVIFFLPGCASIERQSIITVYGTGTVTARPDMVQMLISLAETAPTTRQAQEEVNSKVKAALQILAEAGIEDKNISTASLRFSPEYDWAQGRTLLGQKAEQTISFSIYDITGDNGKIPGIIDRLIQINGIELRQFDFSLKESADFFARSRELAYRKALDKAVQYAELSGLSIIRTLDISEEGGPQFYPGNVMRNQSMFAGADAATGSTSSIVPSGELEISTTVSVTFLVR